jgi:hypothetical protein
MTIEEFKTALRKLMDDQLVAAKTLMTKFYGDLDQLETTAKADPSSDIELINLVMERELKRYEARVDKL